MSKASYTPLDSNPREDFIEKQVDVLPRLCCLTRNNRECEYGFSLRTLKSNGLHVAIDVSKSLPASISGLREGDFILEINGESIDGMEHSQVVQLFNTRPTSVDLLVRNDFNAYINLKNKIDEFNSEKAMLKACRLS
jgi:S1-C subfamily serine protease